VKIESRVKLEEVVVVTHEEDEEVLFKMRAKLFRFDKEAKQWKERGTGDVKFLEHKNTKKIRFLMRREKTFKVCGNHYISPAMKLQENISNDRSWVWACPQDFSEGVPTDELFAIRFANTENAQLFKKNFEECQEKMKKLMESQKESKDVEQKLENLKVSEKEGEKKLEA